MNKNEKEKKDTYVFLESSLKQEIKFEILIYLTKIRTNYNAEDDILTPTDFIAILKPVEKAITTYVNFIKYAPNYSYETLQQLYKNELAYDRIMNELSKKPIPQEKFIEIFEMFYQRVMVEEKIKEYELFTR